MFMSNTYESGLARGFELKLTIRFSRVMVWNVSTCRTLSFVGIFSILEVPNITPTSCVNVHCYYTSRLAELDRLAPAFARAYVYSSSL